MKGKTTSIELQQAQNALEQVATFLKNTDGTNKHKKSLYKNIQELFNKEVKRSFNELFDEQMGKMIEAISRFDFSTRFEITDNPALEHIASYLNRLNEELEETVMPFNMADILQYTSESAGVFITNANGKIRKVNAKAIQLLKLSEEALKGKQIDKLFKDYQIVEEQLKKQSIIKNLPVHVLSKKGKIAVFLNVSKSFNSVGELEGILYNIETELHFDKEINYRMAAHDLVSPLCTQFTLLGIMKEDCLELRNKVDTSIKVVDSLIDSNTESIKKAKAVLANNTIKNIIEQPINFQQLIHSISHSLNIVEQYKNVELSIDDKTKRKFYNNISIVRSIMQNLIHNALKYGKHNQKNQISISIIDKKQGVEIEIQDTGVGINRNIKQRLFKDVLSGNSLKNGHGFGLYGINQYVKKLNGKIKFKSALDVGSTFTAYLPTIMITE